MTQHLVPNVRYIGCPVYWCPQDQKLSWEDRDRLVEMSPIASRAFARLLAKGLSLSEITNKELGRAIGAGLATI